MKKFIRSDSKGRVLKNEKELNKTKEISDTEYNDNDINTN